MGAELKFCEDSIDGAHVPVRDLMRFGLRCDLCGAEVMNEDLLRLASAALVLPPHMAEENARLAEDCGWLIQEQRNRRYRDMWGD